jgi:hypothetical protein
MIASRCSERTRILCTNCNRFSYTADSSPSLCLSLSLVCLVQIGARPVGSAEPQHLFHLSSWRTSLRPVDGVRIPHPAPLNCSAAVRPDDAPSRHRHRFLSIILGHLSGTASARWCGTCPVIRLIGTYELLVRFCWPRLCVLLKYSTFGDFSNTPAGLARRSGPVSARNQKGLAYLCRGRGHWNGYCI